MPQQHLWRSVARRQTDRLPLLIIVTDQSLYQHLADGASMPGMHLCMVMKTLAVNVDTAAGGPHCTKTPHGGGWRGYQVIEAHTPTYMLCGTAQHCIATSPPCTPPPAPRCPCMPCRHRDKVCMRMYCKTTFEGPYKRSSLIHAAVAKPLRTIQRAKTLTPSRTP